MKKIVCLAMMLVAGVTLAAKLSLEDARKQIDAVIAEPTKMTDVLKQLAPADQVTFVADVNAAISALPGSAEDKAATFLSVNGAALKGASKGNLTAVVAEVFATVPVEVLPTVSESFAASAFNRAANPSVTYTDEQFKKIAASVMTTVNKRLEKTDASEVRSGFAGLMMVKASNSSDPEMVNAIVAMLPPSAQESARNDWFPAALAEGEAKNYEAMMAAAEGGDVITLDRVIRISGPQQFDTLLADLGGSNIDPTVVVGDHQQVYDAVVSQINMQNGQGLNNMAATPQPRAIEAVDTDVNIHESIGYQLQETR